MCYSSLTVCRVVPTEGRPVDRAVLQYSLTVCRVVPTEGRPVDRGGEHHQTLAAGAGRAPQAVAQQSRGRRKKVSQSPLKFLCIYQRYLVFSLFLSLGIFSCVSRS